MNSPVILQTSLGAEFLPTFSARKRSFTSVAPHVDSEVSLSSIPGSTLSMSTRQPRLGIGVQLSVLFQVMLRCKVLSALRTHKGSVPCVVSHVSLQVGLLHKCLVTQVTLMGPHITM